MKVSAVTALLLLPLSLRGEADAVASGVIFESGVQQAALIELYTSEGCSSCPPADRWLSQLKSSPGLWKQFVPVAFHVDYWDYIGWKDRFSRPEFSQRERSYAARGGLPTVYTPGMLKNGREWRGWRRGDPVNPDVVPVGMLTVETRGDRLSVRFSPQSSGYDHLDLYVAVLGMGLATTVTRGENAGATLHHDFVVLALESLPLMKTDEGFTATVRISAAGADTRPLALAAWVTEQGRLRPLQAVGGYL